MGCASFLMVVPFTQDTTIYGVEVGTQNDNITVNGRNKQKLGVRFFSVFVRGGIDRSHYYLRVEDHL